MPRNAASLFHSGFDQSRLQCAEDTLRQGLYSGEYTCAAYIVAYHGNTIISGAIGCLSNEKCSPSAGLHTVFDVASLTKPMATATCLLKLVELGEISLDEEVTAFLPKHNVEHLRDVTLRHLATHTSGLPAWENLYSHSESREDAINQLFRVQLQSKPGTQYRYSCLGYIILGLVVEHVSAMPLHTFASEFIFGPLGMANTRFRLPQHLWGTIARTANCEGRAEVRLGEVHDGNAWGLGGVAGNAGLFSTVEDVTTFAQMILFGGKYNGRRILTENSVQLMITNQLPATIGGQGIGFFTKPNPMLAFGESFSTRVAGHTGFTGCSLLLDPTYLLSIVLLTNRVYTGRNASSYLRRRRLFHDIIASAIS